MKREEREIYLNDTDHQMVACVHPLAITYLLPQRLFLALVTYSESEPQKSRKSFSPPSQLNTITNFESLLGG